MAGPVELTRRFTRLRALVIGDAILDTYIEGSAERLCTEGPAPVVRKRVERRLPGGAANVAVNLRAMGAQVTFLSAVGRDEPGETLRERLRARGVDDQWLISDPSSATQHKVRIIADGQLVARLDEGRAACSPAVQRRLLGALRAALDTCDVVLLADYRYGLIFDSMLERLAQLNIRAQRPITLDSKQLGRFRSLGVTVVTPNLDEARRLTGAHLPHEIPASEAGTPGRAREGERVATALLDLLDTEYAAVTMASDGVALVARDGRRWHIPAYPVAQPHDVGAGDSFTSALALALAAGAPADEAVRIGVDAAGIAVSKPFTSVVERRELLQRVSLRGASAAGPLTPRTRAGGRRKEIERLQARLEMERAAGRSIVFANGVFDTLHAGHVAFLRQAKALGDTLVVGVNSDESLRHLGNRPPQVMSERDRAALVAALEPVDHVALFDEATPAELIRALRPHLHVKGGDYADETLPEAEAVRQVGGRLVILPLAGTPTPSARPRQLRGSSPSSPSARSRPLGRAARGEHAARLAPAQPSSRPLARLENGGQAHEA